MKRLIQRNASQRHPLEVDVNDDTADRKPARSQSKNAGQTQHFMPDEQDRKRVVGCLASLLSTKNYSLQFKRQFLDSIVSYVEIESSVAKAYLPLTVVDKGDGFGVRSQESSTSGEDLINIFLEDLESTDTVIWCILRFLLLSNNGYDARVRTIFRELFTILYQRSAGSCSSACSTPSSSITFNGNDSSFEQFETDNEVFEYLGFIIFGYIEHSIGKNLIQMNVRAQQKQKATSTSNNDDKNNKIDVVKIAKITGVSLLAGTAFAITGGLAAPGIAAGVAVFTTSAGALTSTATITTIFGVGGGGLVAHKMKRRTAGLTEFQFVKRSKGSNLSITICISGWISDHSDFTRPWINYFDECVRKRDDPINTISRYVDFKKNIAFLQLHHFFHHHKPTNCAKLEKIVHGYDLNISELINDIRKKYGTVPSEFWDLSNDTVKEFLFGDASVSIQDEESSGYNTELYTVEWESELLEDLSGSLQDLVRDVGVAASRELLKTTVASTLIYAIMWPAALISAANTIDGTWTLAIERSDEAGVELARSLLESTDNVGLRPVTLIGYSFGARVIYRCLKELGRRQEEWLSLKRDARRKIREPASIIEDVILMGLPNHYNPETWLTIRKVVCGRVVNCFSRKDWVLGIMFQLKKISVKPVCGTIPIEVPGIENFDVTEIIQNHNDYGERTSEVLEAVQYDRGDR